MLHYTNKNKQVYLQKRYFLEQIVSSYVQCDIDMRACGRVWVVAVRAGVRCALTRVCVVCDVWARALACVCGVWCVGARSRDYTNISLLDLSENNSQSSIAMYKKSLFLKLISLNGGIPRY
jgi:hypothetical protein